MTMITTIFHDEVTNTALQGTGMILGWSGIRICFVRIRFVRILGDPGIRLAFPPHTGPAAQDWIRKNNLWLNELCQKNMLDMNDHARKPLLTLARYDGGQERIIYQIVAFIGIADDGTITCRVDDFVDPEFNKIDRGVASRAPDARLAVERKMGDA